MTSDSLSSAEGTFLSSGLGSLIRVPLFAAVRLGYSASRYGDWPLTVNVGLGPVLVHVNTANSVLGSVTYVAPSACVSALFADSNSGSRASWLDTLTFPRPPT